jgi:hypothetical protein
MHCRERGEKQSRDVAAHGRLASNLLHMRGLFGLGVARSEPVPVTCAAIVGKRGARAGVSCNRQAPGWRRARCLVPRVLDGADTHRRSMDRTDTAEAAVRLLPRVAKMASVRYALSV